MNRSKPNETYFEKISPRQMKRWSIKVWLLRVMIVAGFGAFFNYLSWWFSDDRLASPWIALLFCGAMLYAGLQIIGVWILYLFAERHPAPPSWPDGLTVDVFVTAYQEPHNLVERTFTSACAMRGEHRTWLLDDGSDPWLAAMAKRLGAGYLAREDHTNAKAGNVNAALEKTEGDIVGLTRWEVIHRFEKIIRFAELEDFVDSPLRTYSAGMQMRLAFSVAVHVDPEILLIDEVLAVGDMPFQRKCLNRIAELKRNGCAIVFVSHDLPLVSQICDHAIWLNSGELVASGPAQHVTNQYADAMEL